MSWLNLVLVATAAPVLVACLYLAALTVLSRGRIAAPPPAGPVRFRVVVPAHDEEAGIGATLRGLRRLDYPAQLWRTVVVADNCSDGTARVARAHGALVVERDDPERRGKGYALDHAFRRLLAEAGDEWDAVVVVDADSAVTPNLLRAFAARITAGERAVQALYLPRGAAGNSLVVITEVGFTAFHLVRSAARERLGLSAGLRGNGMAFTRDLLDAVPHDAYSRTEDLEFGVRLGLAGVRVAFAAEATVHGDVPDRSAVAARQRGRWIGGRVEIARRMLPALLTGAVRRRSAMLADLAADLLVPPLSLLLVLVAAGTAAAATSAALGGWGGGGAAIWALAMWTLAASALALHVFDAAARAGRAADLIRASRALPAYALGKVMIAVRSLLPGDREWVRTARHGEAP
jgi:1,2-diacylglycerol 3-beta-glucosyltransferase